MSLHGHDPFERGWTMIIESNAKSAGPSKQAYKEALVIAIVFIALAGLKELAFYLMGYNALVSKADVIFILVLAVLASALRLLFPWFSRRSLVASLEIDAEKAVIHRFGGKSEHFKWDNLTGVGYACLDEIWQFHIGKKLISICSEGFDREGWKNINGAIWEHLPETMEIEDMSATSAIKLCRVVERLTVPSAIVGLLVTVSAIATRHSIVGLIVGGVTLTLMIVYIALYYQFGFRSYETPALNILGWLGFYGIKLLALIPLCVIYYCVLNPDASFDKPQVRNNILFYISNISFFGH